MLLLIGCSKKNPIQPKVPIDEYAWIDNNPCWSPDGGYIVYEHLPDSGTGVELWMINISTSTKFFLCKGMLPDWSSDGNWIVFSWPPYAASNIYKIKPNGDSLQLITNQGGPHPHWLPDNRRISFWGGPNDSAGLWIIDVNDPMEKKYLGYYTGYADWSPDGLKLVMCKGYTGTAPPLDQIVLADSMAQNQVILWGDAETNTNRGPEFSPMGTSIVFSSQPSHDHQWNGTDGGALPQIWRIKPDGTNATKLTTEGGEEPSWSPDGSKIVYCRFNPWVDPKVNPYNGRLWIMHADGTNKQQLTY